MLTPEEIERRRNFVTASDVAPICGKSPWANAADVWAEKVSGSSRDTSSESIDWGNRLEQTVIERASDQLGVILPGDWLVHENGINACSLDGRTASGEPVEAKTSGIVGPGSPQQWGEPGTDEIPEYYLLQVHAQLLVTGAKRAWVAALIGGRGFVLYCVHFDQRVADGIQRLSESFWNNHVIPKIAPGNVRPSIETLKNLRREPGSVVNVADELVEAWIVARDERLAAEKREEAAKAAMLDCLKLGDGKFAEAGLYSGGRITYFEESRNYKAKDAYTSTSRMLRHKAEKQSKRIVETSATVLAGLPSMAETISSGEKVLA